LGSRRSADSDLRDLDLAILHNLNLLAGTHQESLPVTKTLDHFIGHGGSISRRSENALYSGRCLDIRCPRANPASA
jgi:hypothetical protein